MGTTTDDGVIYAGAMREIASLCEDARRDPSRASACLDKIEGLVSNHLPDPAQLMLLPASGWAYRTDKPVPPPSPEVTGLYRCPECGEASDFIGADDRIFGTQRFTVSSTDEDGRATDVDYSAFQADIGGSYCEIQCGNVECEATVWRRP